MRVAYYNRGADEPVILGSVSGQHMWEVVVWAEVREIGTGQVVKTTSRIKPAARCFLADVVGVAQQALSDALSPDSDQWEGGAEVLGGGFTVDRLR